VERPWENGTTCEDGIAMGRLRQSLTKTREIEERRITKKSVGALLLYWLQLEVEGEYPGGLEPGKNGDEGISVCKGPMGKGEQYGANLRGRKRWSRRISGFDDL